MKQTDDRGLWPHGNSTKGVTRRTKTEVGGKGKALG